MHILEVDNPEIAHRLRKVDGSQQRRLVARCCLRLWRSEPIGPIVDPEVIKCVERILEAAATTNSFSADQLRTVDRLANEIDDEYLRLQEAEATAETWLRVFSIARLLTALSAGFGAESWKNLADAIYELSKVGDDESETLMVIRQEIGHCMNER